jgi:hypothetical protein
LVRHCLSHGNCTNPHSESSIPRPQREALNWERQRSSASAASINSAPKPLKAYYSIQPTCCPQEIRAFQPSVCLSFAGQWWAFLCCSNLVLVQGHPPLRPSPGPRFLVGRQWLSRLSPLHVHNHRDPTTTTADRILGQKRRGVKGVHANPGGCRP